MIADKQPFYIFSLRIIYLWIWLYPVISDVDYSSWLNLYMLHLSQTHPIDSPSFYFYLCLVFVCSCSRCKHPDPEVSYFSLARHFFGLLFYAAADSFPTLVFCCRAANEGGFQFGCRLPGTCSELLSRTDDRPAHITESRRGESGEAAWGFNDSLVARNSKTVAECWCCVKNGVLFPKTWESMATGKWPGSQG